MQRAPVPIAKFTYWNRGRTHRLTHQLSVTRLKYLAGCIPVCFQLILLESEVWRNTCSGERGGRSLPDSGLGEEIGINLQIQILIPKKNYGAPKFQGYSLREKNGIPWKWAELTQTCGSSFLVTGWCSPGLDQSREQLGWWESWRYPRKFIETQIELENP